MKSIRRAILAAISAVTLALVARAEPTNVMAFRAWADQALLEARQRHQAASNEPAAAVALARALFERAEFATNDTERAALAEQGITFCRSLAQAQPQLAAAPYYLALHLGELARTKSLGALKLVHQIEAAFLQAITLDGSYDEAGAHRAIAVLYRDCPGWPVSLGSKDKALKHALRAVELKPAFPDNLLNLLETYVQWGRKKEARAELPKLEAALTPARLRLTGAVWASTWADWDARLTQLTNKLSAPAKNTRYSR